MTSWCGPNITSILKEVAWCLALGKALNGGDAGQTVTVV